jgi:hypothetical protein
MVVTTRQEHGPFVDGELPGYLAESPPPPGEGVAGLHDAWDAARHLALSFLDAPRGGPDPGGSARATAIPRPSSRPATVELSGGFFRSAALPGARLGAIVAEWWETGAGQGSGDDGGHGERRVDASLRLELPRADARGGWTATGRVRRCTRWHWVPVIVELWPAHDHWTIVMMTPRRRVMTSRRYFRIGNAALDRLTTQLGATSAGRRSGGGDHPWAAV